MPRANKVFIPKEELSLEVIKQYRVHCPGDRDKAKFLKDLFPMAEKLCQTMVFVKTRESCRELYETLRKEGWSVSALEGGMPGDQRDRIVSEFREGKTKIMVATDVLSRGFDVSQISLVVNYDPPVQVLTDANGRHTGSEPAYETYMHRIGRSGRFGRKGAAFNLWTGDRERHVLDKIEEYFAHKIQEVHCEDEESVEKILQEAELA